MRLTCKQAGGGLNHITRV